MAKKDSVQSVLRPTDARYCIEKAMQAKRPVFLWGPPGVGKSDIIAAIGAANNRPVIDMRLILMDPTDIKGIPYYDPTKNTMRWAIPGELPQPGETHMNNAILFLDEMNSAPASVQGAAYQLILNRRIGAYELPAGVDIIAAGNRETDKGVTYRMPSPLANRFVHLEMEANFDDWQTWAVNAKINPDVVGFLSHHKQNLFLFDPKSPDKAFCTPRSWKFVSDLLEQGISKESLLRAMISGTVGSGVSYAFMDHLKYASKLPKASDVLTGRAKDCAVQEVSARYSLTVSMCYQLKEWYQAIGTGEAGKEYTNDEWHKAVDNFFEYMMNNFSDEMVILGARTALREYKLDIQHKKLKNFTLFFGQYGKYVVD